MAQSPRSMFSGSISFGLISIPVTVAKATSDTRETSLITVNVDENGVIEKIDRSERLASGKPINNKRKAVEVDGEFRILDESEMEQIEGATKSAVLHVLDVQPLKYLPTVFSTGIYYVRFDDKSKQHPRPFATLVAALAKTEMALVTKWGQSGSRQRLAIISVESGVLILRTIPFITDARLTGDRERLHFKSQPIESEVEKMIEFLNTSRQKTFAWNDYRDEGLEMRQNAVQRILDGIEPAPEVKPVEEPTLDLFAALEASLAALPSEQ